MNEPTQIALDILSHPPRSRAEAGDILTSLDDAGLRLCWASDRTTELLARDTDATCATCGGKLGRELVAVDAAGAVHCRVCEARRLDALQTQADRAGVSPPAASVK